MKEMGMTDKQFNGFIRFLIDDLKEVREEKDEEKKNKRIEKILENKFIESQTPLTRLFYIYLISMLDIPRKIIFPYSLSTQNTRFARLPQAIRHDKHYF